MTIRNNFTIINNSWANMAIISINFTEDNFKGINNWNTIVECF